LLDFFITEIILLRYIGLVVLIMRKDWPSKFVYITQKNLESSSYDRHSEMFLMLLFYEKIYLLDFFITDIILLKDTGLVVLINMKNLSNKIFLIKQKVL